MDDMVAAGPLVTVADNTASRLRPRAESNMLVNVLLVEDNPADVQMLKIAAELCESRLNVVKVAADGDEALNWIQENHSTPKAPDLILLDLSLPKRSGLEILKEVRQQLKIAIPIVIFSSSAAPSDIRDAYQLGANGYFRKPDRVDTLEQVLLAIESYWNLAVKPCLF